MERSWLLALACVASLAFAPCARAQVINGESTYENNFIHTPPSEASRQNDDSSDRKKADKTGIAEKESRDRK